MKKSEMGGGQVRFVAITKGEKATESELPTEAPQEHLLCVGLG